MKAYAKRRAQILHVTHLCGSPFVSACDRMKPNYNVLNNVIRIMQYSLILVGNVTITSCLAWLSCQISVGKEIT